MKYIYIYLSLSLSQKRYIHIYHIYIYINRYIYIRALWAAAAAADLWAAAAAAAAAAAPLLFFKFLLIYLFIFIIFLTFSFQSGGVSWQRGWLFWVLALVWWRGCELLWVLLWHGCEEGVGPTVWVGGRWLCGCYLRAHIPVSCFGVWAQTWAMALVWRWCQGGRDRGQGLAW